MAIEGIEWLFVAVIVLVLFLWGPEKIPKIAEALGRARWEFERTSRKLTAELEGEVEESDEESDEKLIEVAKSLGIETEGKTKDEIAQEIIERAGREATQP